jgi:hypothetical protein
LHASTNCQALQNLFHNKTVFAEVAQSDSPDPPKVVLLVQGQTQGSMLQQRTKKNLTTFPFSNTREADEVSPEVEVGVAAGIQCLQP